MQFDATLAAQLPSPRSRFVLTPRRGAGSKINPVDSTCASPAPETSEENSPSPSLSGKRVNTTASFSAARRPPAERSQCKTRASSFVTHRLSIPVGRDAKRVRIRAVTFRSPTLPIASGGAAPPTIRPRPRLEKFATLLPRAAAVLPALFPSGALSPSGDTSLSRAVHNGRAGGVGYRFVGATT